MLGAKEACVVLGRLLTWSFTCPNKLAGLYSLSLLSPTVHVTSCTLEQLILTDVLITGILDIVLKSPSSPHSTLLYHMEEVT